MQNTSPVSRQIPSQEINGENLDSDTQNAYNDDGNQNGSINAPTFPALSDGETPISFSGGIDRVEIIPRWWEL